MSTLEIDTTDAGGSIDAAARLGLDAEIITEHGPAGGWPVVRATGPAVLLVDWAVTQGYEEDDVKDFIQ